MTNKIPTVTIVGCGGCGTNMLSKLNPHITKRASEHVNTCIIDTSKSNQHDLPEGIEVFSLGQEGSGKLRSKNAKAISRKVEGNDIMESIGDIAILIFSMSGGSGSVIAPTLSRQLKNKGRGVILVGVTDDITENDCKNSINTFKSFDNIANIDKVHLPLMLFTNISSTWIDTDTIVVKRVNQFIDLFVNENITFLDVNDKLNFIDPLRIGHGEPGVFGIGISDTMSLDEQAAPGEADNRLREGQPVHTYITVNSNGKPVNVSAKSAFIGASPEIEYCAFNGIEIDENILDALLKANQFHSTRSVSRVSLMDKFEEIESKTDSTGLVL